MDPLPSLFSQDVNKDSQLGLFFPVRIRSAYNGLPAPSRNPNVKAFFFFTFRLRRSIFSQTFGFYDLYYLLDPNRTPALYTRKSSSTPVQRSSEK